MSTEIKSFGGNSNEKCDSKTEIVKNTLFGEKKF